MMESQTEQLRALFPATRNYAYFNHASDGPLPVTAVQAVREWMEYGSQHGVVEYARAEAMTNETRAMVAQLMHVTPGEIAFGKNTSSGIILAINSIEWQAGDNIVMMSDAFPSDSYPYYFLRPAVEKRFVTSAELARGPECVFRLIDEHTRVVSLDWVSFLSGVRCDIADIARYCRERGVWFIVDAIQGLGVVDMDFAAVDADFACGSVAKWLHGLQGIAILYVNRRTLPRLRPVNLGWLSARWEEFNYIFTPKPLRTDARQLEEGTKNYIGILSLHESLKIMLDLGLPGIERHTRHLVGLLRGHVEQLGFEIITPADPAHSAGILTCRRAGTDMAALFSRLTERKVACALRENCLRFSPHFYNTEEEVGRVAEAMAESTSE